MRIYKNGQYYCDIKESSEILNISDTAFSLKQGRYGFEQLSRIIVDSKVFISVIEIEKILEEQKLRELVSFVMEFLVKGLSPRLFRNYFDDCIARTNVLKKVNLSHQYSYKKAAELETHIKPFLHLYYSWLETDLTEADFLKKRLRDIDAPTPDWSKSFLITHYWQLQKTVPMIAEEFGTNKTFVWKKIAEYGLQKKKNGIRLHGKRKFKMSEEGKIKRRNQPHAKRVTAIDATTLEIKKTYRSIAATEEDGFCRENVKKAVRTVGVHKGHLWALEGMEAGVIRTAQKRGLEKKLEILRKERPDRKWMQEHYVEQNLTVKKCAELRGCSTGVISRCVKEYGLFKRKNKPKLNGDILLAELTAGKSIADIAQKYKRTKKTVQTYASRWKTFAKLAQYRAEGSVRASGKTMSKECA